MVTRLDCIELVGKVAALMARHPELTIADIYNRYTIQFDVSQRRTFNVCYNSDAIYPHFIKAVEVTAELLRF